MEQAVKNRDIKHVWHFTRIENLDSILSHGIIPRKILEDKSIDVNYNDELRLDSQKGATSFSLGHPNYKMFYSLRKQHPNQEWVVIACRPDILWEKDCAFCHENAASSSVTSIPLPYRKGITAFNKMFTPIVGKPSRQELGLKDSCPTNPQAEVLIFDIVEPEYIVGAVCQNTRTSDRLKKEYSDFDFLYHRALFSARLDYEHWK